LLAAVVELITKGWSHKRWLPETYDKPGLDGLLALIRAISDEFQRDTNGVRLLYMLMFEAASNNEELRQEFVDFHRGMRADLADIVKRGIADGSIRPDVDV